MAEGNGRLAELHIWKDDLGHQLDLQLAVLRKPDLEHVVQGA